MTDKYIERDVNVDRQIWERFHYEDSHISKKEVWIGNTYTHRLNYDYDGNGNITSVSDDISGTSVTYTYDKANQLTKAVHSDGREEVYTYDDAGNILTFNNGSGIHRYTYGDGSWGDLLTKYDGQTITYDGIGNPLTDGTWTYTWEHGRELMTMSGGGTTWTYTYDANGMRTKRTNGTTTYSYVYNGGSLSQMTVGSNTLNFAYDASGTPMSVTYNGTNYYYVTNLQGDVIAILNSSGSTVVTYTYDAWGNILTTTGSMATTLGAHNPLRYRGYVCDSETELYYLQSRYYDPQIGRFINADALVSTGQGVLGNNMFVYCNNNPTNYMDRSGRNTETMQWWVSTMWWLCYIDGTLPIGDIVFTIATIILLQDLGNANDEMEEAYNASKAEAASKASSMLDFASTTAPPPPPNKGGKGTQVTSKTLYTKYGKNGFRIDVENPGNRPGQIHLQQGGEKYIYNIADQTFRIGSSTGILAPDSIQQLLTLPEVIIAIAKGLQILGYF